MQQINIVISGFTPYEGIDVNPAVLVPAAVAKQWADPAQSQAISEELLQDIAVTVTNVTLPVSFAKAWPTLLEAIEQAKPDIVIATAETLQTGANWSEGFILPERFFLPMTIRIWMLCQKQWDFPAAICAMQSNFAAPFCKVITSGWKTRPITECTLWATNGTSGAV